MNTLTQIFDWLLAAGLRASLLTLAVLLIQAALHRHLTARMRYALWLPVLVVLLMPVFPQSRWSMEYFFQTPPPTVHAPIMPAAPATAIESAPVLFEAATPRPAPINWQRIFLLTWLSVSAGMLVLGGFSFILTLRRFQRSRHPAGEALLSTLAQVAREIRLRHVPRVLIASTISSPAVTGLLRPILLLPAEFDHEFSPAEARLVLKHELMHLKRGDLPMNALMCVLMALHWFNPLLWIAFFKIRADREAACDAQVLHDAPHDRRIEYGHALLKVETAFCPRGFSLGFVGIFQRGTALRSRIRFIAAHRAPHPVMKALNSLCIVLLTFLGITRAQQPKAADSEPLIAIEIKVIKFKQATDWNFDGRLPAQEAASLLPAPTVLSPATLKTCLEELTKKEASITSYPRMVTASGKEVVIKNIVNQPTTGENGKVVYVPIGLVCKLTPSVKDEMIHLDMDITDSSLIAPPTGAAISESHGEHVSARSRTYKSTHETLAGHSWVVADWADGKPESKRPVLYIITPHVIDPKKGGLPESAGSDFTVGNSAFRPGDTILITSVTCSDDKLTVGLEYELSSADEASTALYLTSKSKASNIKSPPFDPAQQALVKRGRGSIVLHHPLPAEGLPHVTLYDTQTRRPIGGIYFGTAAEAAESRKLDLSYMTEPTKAPATDPADFIKAKLNKIIIPVVQFQGATVEEALEYLRIKGRDFDTSATDPKTRGVSILYRAGNPPSKAIISLDLKDVPLGEALRYTAKLASLKMSIQPYAVVVGETVPAANVERLKAEGSTSQIIIPSIEFREASLAECIDFIRAKTRELDPKKVGINVIIQPGGDEQIRISLSLKDVPVEEALRYCAELSRHKLITDGRSYLLSPVSIKASAGRDQDAAPPADSASLKAADLRKASQRQYDFSKARLGDVLRFLATDAGINFFALPDDNPINQKLVTFSIRSSPFEVLETLCRSNGLTLLLDNERWFIRPADDRDLVSKIYPVPQSKAAIETILNDINAILGGDDSKTADGAPKPSVTFKKDENSLLVKATRIQQFWVSGYFQGMNRSMQKQNTK